MKKLLIICVALLALAGCKKTKTPSVHPDWTYSSVMYEVNIRQFSPEGTFAGVEAQLPRLKELGVDILWLMPMYEIGTEGRKGTLGSYYAISDYKKVNPEFGTMEDFEHLLAAAHKLGFKVILDWVANQTAPDNVWMTEKPADFYERDADGNAIWEYDWTDTRSLNYDNEDVWWAQDDAMRFWLEKGVDGFRCDAAGEVPAAFWKGILPKMNKDYPDIYLLAEAERDNLADATETFDANYAWELHHLLNSLAQGRKTVADLKDYVTRDAARFPKEAFRLTFTSNHDENSWSGTEFEREGAAANACAVLLPCRAASRSSTPARKSASPAGSSSSRRTRSRTGAPMNTRPSGRSSWTSSTTIPPSPPARRAVTSSGGRFPKAWTASSPSTAR